ncbi:MAG TPA: hypothetical protein VFE33_22360 [Thermoanaerobaculia bacterium]|nr:hypothetical protein [Thermoanaerobaculia bacterium]
MADGIELKTVGELTETNYLPDSPSNGRAFRVQHLEIVQPRPSNRRNLTYLLTNVTGLQSVVSFSEGDFTLHLKPLDDSARNTKRIEVLRSVLPTATIETTTTTPLTEVEQAVDDTCDLLSLALGTRVEWILREEARENCLRIYHSSRITKRYCPLSVIENDTHAISDYLRQAMGGRFRRERERIGMTRAVLNTYLDAKSESDFLQVRALKLVIAVEMLKAEYMKVASASSFVVDSECFRSAKPRLKKALKEAFKNAEKDEREALYANLEGLNRTPFRRQLEDLCGAARMPIAPGELERFVASRNKLVHYGLFYFETATESEKAKIPPLPNLQEEFLWLLHFVDRLFLRSVDYEGPYLDWSIPNGPRPAFLSRGPIASISSHSVG